MWSVVASTVRPFPGRAAPKPEREMSDPPPATGKPAEPPRLERPAPRLPRSLGPPGEIEPNRLHRIAKTRPNAGAVLDLHGFTQDQARAVLAAFLRRAQDQGESAVLVITGKGGTGEGILRRRTPEWLAEPPLRGLVAGVSQAHPRHGGAGALYVALKRRR